MDTSIRALQDGDKSPEGVVKDLERNQTRLRTARNQAGRELNAKISKLTNAIGFFRVGVDTGTAGSQQTRQVAAALQAVVDNCTTS